MAHSIGHHIVPRADKRFQNDQPAPRRASAITTVYITYHEKIIQRPSPHDVQAEIAEGVQYLPHPGRLERILMEIFRCRVGDKRFRRRLLWFRGGRRVQNKKKKTKPVREHHHAHGALSAGSTRRYRRNSSFSRLSNGFTAIAITDATVW